MFRFSVHLVLLLLKTLNDLHSWPNSRLQLLNLIIEHEFEFLKLLCLLEILVNLLLLVLDCSLTLDKFVLH